MATGVGRGKCNWQHSMAHPRKSPYRRKNLADISYTHRVLSQISFHGNGCRSEKMQFAAFNGPSRNPLPIDAKSRRYLLRKSQISLAWQRGSVREKCNWQHSMAHPRKPPYRRKNLPKKSYVRRVIANFVPNFVAIATGVDRRSMAHPKKTL